MVIDVFIFLGQKYLCTFHGCDYQTIYKRALQSHVNNIHSNQKRYNSQLCTLAANDNSMRRHCKVHDPNKLQKFQCTICEYRAPLQSYIRSHMLTHTHTHRYQCDQCSFSTTRGSSLRVHLLRHMGVRPWKCDCCKYTSVTKQKVERHISNIHAGSGTVVKEQSTVIFNMDDYKKQPLNEEC